MATALGLLPQTTAEAQVDDRVLILAGTVTGGTSSIEATQAAANGMAVDIVDAATWGSMTQDQFANYRAIILGDPTCEGPPPTAAINAAAGNANTWGPVVNGNIVIVGSDPVFHADQGGETLTRRSIDFALAEGDKTGAYITLSCYYHDTASNTPIPLLDGIGSGGFTMTGVGCYNSAHIVAESSALTGLTDADLSNWGCSVHEAFQTWPGALIPLAIARDFDSSYTASDGSQGPPYILAGGDIQSFPLSLSPLDASADVNEQHTVTALLLDGATREPIVGAKIGFSVITGPNKGSGGSCVPATCLSDGDGQVAFSYTSNGTTGTDSIQTFYDVNDNGEADVGEPQTTASVTWTAAPAPQPAECDRPLAIGVRGSGETTKHFDGFGRTTRAMVDGFRDEYGKPIDELAIDYPSIGVEALFSPRNIIALSGVQDFLNSATLGKAELKLQLVLAHARCPNRSLIVFGYSQGAMAAHRAIVELATEDAGLVDRIDAVGLIADPLREGHDSYNLGTAAQTLDGVAITTGVWPSGSLPGDVADRADSVCLEDDAVCAFDRSESAIRRTKAVHSSYWRGWADVVGKRAARRLS